MKKKNKIIPSLVFLLLGFGCSTQKTLPMNTSVEYTRFILDVTIIDKNERMPCLNYPPNFSQGCYRSTIENDMRVVYITVRRPEHTQDKIAFCILGHETAHGIWEYWHQQEPTGC